MPKENLRKDRKKGKTGREMPALEAARKIGEDLKYVPKRPEAFGDDPGPTASGKRCFFVMTVSRTFFGEKLTVTATGHIETDGLGAEACYRQAYLQAHDAWFQSAGVKPKVFDSELAVIFYHLSQD